ncbi:Ig-like domain-containing protein [Buttiauxella gaviniae]|uniref:Ig-like domain-containing protein n=1 Tax=Buttiauxella gaviniae TaxID=82990 RepID=UPI0039B0653D
MDYVATADITINQIAGDDIINAAESQQQTTNVTGTVGGDARVHDVVTLTVNGHEFTGTVQPLPDGQLGYSIPVNTADLANGQQVHASITTTDYAGNTATATADHTVTPDYVAEATITIDDITTDNVLNHTELNNLTQSITGTVGGDAKVGDVVDLNFNGTHVYGKVEEFGNHQLGYKIDVNSSIFGDNNVILNKDVNFTASVTSHDNAQNEVTVTTDHTVHVDNHAYNGVSINAVAGDNIVSHAESQREVFITGQVSGKDAQVGDDVEVLVQGTTYTGKVLADSNGHLYYKVPVPAGALTEGNTGAQVTVTSHDKVGNEAVATQTHNFSVDLHADATINIHELTAGSVLNHDELAAPKQLITGDVGGDARIGDKVSIEINGHFYGGKVIDLGNGHLGYQIPVDSSAFGDNHQKLDSNVKIIANVTSHDAVGNEVTVSTEHSVHIDNHAEAVNTIGTVAGDDIVNAHESRMPTFISGAVTGDAQAGDPVIVHVNNVDYNGVVVKGSDGKLHYEVPLPNGALHEGQNNVTVTITGHDGSGNISTAVDHKTVTVDTHANNSVTINDATSDNILNHTELGHHNQTITGVVGGDAQIGDEVTLEINGHYYRGRVEDMHDGKGTLGYKIPVPSTEFGDNKTILNKDVSVKATLVSHDAAGNEAIVVSEHTIHVDNHAYNGVTINTVAGDDVVNAGESKHETLVTGRITGKDAHIGDAVDVTVGKTTVHGTIFADPQGHLYYEAKIPTGVLIEGNNDVTVKVTSHDEAHNEAVATEHTTITLDTHADATINIHELTAGPVLNYDELDTPKQLITGDVGGDAQVGDKVSIEINGHFYGGKVIDLGNGHLGYQIPVDSSAFGDNQQQLGGKVTIIASVTSHDAAGNEVTVHTDHTVQLDNHAEAGITINPLTGDGIINNVESQQVNTKLTGTVNGDVHKGDEVLVMVNGHPYEATVQELPHQNGALGYSVDVLTTDLLADPNPDAYIVGYDANGNIQLAQATQNVGIDLQAEATITIDPVTGDNMINGDESHNEFTTITGKVGGDVKVGDLVHLEVNGIDMTTQVFKDPVTGQLGYKIDVSTYDLMADPKITATVTATDNANNVITVHADQDIIVDTRVDATISVDSVTQDNVLNGAELKQGYTLVSGKVTGEMHPGDPLTLTVNGQVYHGFVENQGVDAQGHMIMGYHIPVSTADIQANPNIHASIDVTDAAKNHAVATANHHVGIDDHATASVTINIVSGDDVLNANDQQAPTTIINGKVGGDVKAGDTVHVIVNGVDHPVTVADQGHGLGLGYSIAVNTSDLLADPKIVATVDATDKAGNTASASTSHDVVRADGAHATITIDPVTDDNTINNAEAHNPLTTVTGHVNGDVNPGDLVDLDVNGQHYYGTVDKNLAYKIDVSTDDLLSVKSPLLHASVTGHDAAGNTVLATTDHAVGVATIEVHNLQINGSHDFWLIEGYVGGDAKEGDKIVIHVGADTYNTSVIKLPDGHLGFNGDDLHDPVTDKHVYIGPQTISNNTDITVEITTTDPYGNPETATAHLLGNVSVPPLDGNGTVTPPQHTPPDVHITVSPVAGNNVINQQESQSGHTTIRGTVSGDVHVGDDVIIYIGTRPYHGQVFEHPNLPGEYSYKIDVDTDELNAHPGFSVTMFGGNSHVEGMVTFDTDVHATITLDDVAGDNTINIAESHKPTTTVSGTVTGDVNDGDNVTLLINGNSLTAQVHQDPVTGELRFTKEVSTDDLRQDPTIKVSVTGHDDQGNTIIASDDKTIAVDTSISASVTIDPIGHHNVLNLNDTQQLHTTITGKVGGDVNPGDEVTVNVNGHIYDHIKIDGNHSYSVDVLTSDMANGGKITAQVTGHDAAGNTTPGSANLDVTVDTTAAGNITMNTVSGDNVLSYHDLQSPTTRISGTVGGDAKVGDEVTITVNNNPTTVKVIELPHMNGQLGYVADVNTHDLSVKPDIHVTVTGTDSVGNSFTAESSKTIVIDDHADVTMNVNDVAGDNVLNLAESKLGKTTITGTVHGDVHEGDKVTIHVNGNDLPGTLHHQADGSFTFSLDVNTSDLLADQTITYKVTGVDQYGNTLTITETNTITIDQIAENQIHIGTVAGDDTVNIVEHQGPTTTISGVVDGDAHDGDVVTLEINGKTYHGSVSDHDGKLTYDIPVNNSDLKEGDNTVTVSVTGQDAAGNPATSTDTHNITLDTTIDAHITLDPVAANDVINAAAADHVIITGTITTDSDARPGDKVTVEINHKIFTGDVKVYSDGHVGYDISVDRKYLQEGDNDIKVSVDAKDAAGNTITVDAGHHVLMDTQVRAAIHLDNVAGNNVINAKEVDHVSVTGTIDRDTDAQLGDHVTVTVNGKSFPGEVKVINGHLGYDIHVDKGYLHEGTNTFDVSVSATDAAGNAITVHDSHDVHVDTQLGATITLEPVAANDVINAAAADHVSVTGTVGTDSDAKLGDEVTVTVNGKSFTGEVKEINGHPGYDIHVDKGYLHEGTNTFDVSIKATDGAGNEITVHAGHDVQVDTQLGASITLEPVAGNDVINAAGSDSVSVKGVVSTDSDAKLGDEVTVTVNGKSFTGVVQDINGHPGYNIPVDKGYLHEGGNTFDVSIKATDGAGNEITVHAGHEVLMDTHLNAAIHLDNVAGNNVINAKEVDHVSVTGTIDRDTDAQLGDHVTVTINHQSFTGVVSVINGHLGYDIPVDKGYLQDGKNTFDVSINATDKAGNAITVHDSHDVLVDTHADAKITINNVTDDNRIDSQEARHHVTHITGQIDSADVHNNEHINVTINDKHYDVVLHEDNGHLTYDVPVNTNELHIGKNSVGVSVIANDDHGNTNVIHQKADFTMDDPSHRGKPDVDGSDKSHHAANAHSHDNGLSNLFDDSHDTFSFNLAHDSKGHHGDESLKIFTGKENHGNEKVDLSDLAKELHENPDITHMIKAGDAPGGKGDAQHPAHSVHTAGDPISVMGHDAHDSHGSSHYSMDHLIPKPEHYHS